MSGRAGIAEGMVEPTASIFTALGHPLRVRIVDRLITAGVATPNELANEFGESQQNVSKHLKTLTQAGLVIRRKDGGSALYSVRDDATTKILSDGEAVAHRLMIGLSADAGLTAMDRGAEKC